MKPIHTVLFVVIALTGLTYIAAQARAQTPEKLPPPEDIRCVIVAMQISISTDAAQRAGGNMLAMYYVGRLDQYPAKAIEDAIFNETRDETQRQIDIATVTPRNEPLRPRCHRPSDGEH
jgi:hypothetical protein